jgi:hypothetical protein
MVSIEKIKREGLAEENHKRFLFTLRARKYVYLFVVTATYEFAESFEVTLKFYSYISTCYPT